MLGFWIDSSDGEWFAPWFWGKGFSSLVGSSDCGLGDLLLWMEGSWVYICLLTERDVRYVLIGEVCILWRDSVCGEEMFTGW